MKTLLCWSYSRHYVFTIGQKEKETANIFLLGGFTADQVLNEYPRIDQKAKINGCGIFSRLELKICLLSWAKHVKGNLNYETHNRHVLWLKRYNVALNYIKNPWLVDLRGMDSV